MQFSIFLKFRFLKITKSMRAACYDLQLNSEVRGFQSTITLLIYVNDNEGRAIWLKSMSQECNTFGQNIRSANSIILYQTSGR